ncbi:wax ester/triacylglycerol synthase family O-acyltransferase [Rhodococcus koreensis]|uniref:wax ester/triacylglycerol synthase family O-acyltransferase n=1 Tax=Rhodococcus koreensis TaxID=99653 RepID=UPI00197CCFD9|nr:wax ester/triacylglycerol synthase family O-acyltransferase [Rhodococcus koreensis]QSE84697.1 wax ester/triacylglycerol synthase family O-acyltransferase [Rhodococcus koreensis]
MHQLSSLDAQLLDAETSTTFTHVGALSVLGPTTPGRGLAAPDLRALVGSRLHLVGPLRWRLQEVPLGLDLPYWVDSESLDLGYHVREATLPGPGTDEQLADQIARLAARPLNRNKPLWECWLVHGLTGGRQAIYTKVHPAVIDGLTAAQALAVLMDTSPRPHVVPHRFSDEQYQAAGVLGMVGKSVWHLGTLPAQLLWSSLEMAPHLPELAGTSTVPGAGMLTRRLARFAQRWLPPAPPPASPTPPETPFNGPVTANRRFAFTSLPLGEVEAVGAALGFTADDVVTALCTSVLRRWLIDHDALPGTALAAAMPVSVRTETGPFATARTRLSLVPVALPTDDDDPARRLQRVHTSLTAAPRRFRSAPATLVRDFGARLPQAVRGLISRTPLRALTTPTPPVNLVISHAVGPTRPVYAAGAEVTGNFPISAVTDHAGITIAAMSYDRHLDVGILACRELVPDVWDVTGHLHEALAELTACTRNVRHLRPRRPPP